MTIAKRLYSQLRCILWLWMFCVRVVNADALDVLANGGWQCSCFTCDGVGELYPTCRVLNIHSKHRQGTIIDTILTSNIHSPTRHNHENVPQCSQTGLIVQRVSRDSWLRDFGLRTVTSDGGVDPVHCFASMPNAQVRLSKVPFHCANGGNRRSKTVARWAPPDRAL